MRRLRRRWDGVLTDSGLQAVQSVGSDSSPCSNFQSVARGLLCIVAWVDASVVLRDGGEGSYRFVVPTSLKRQHFEDSRSEADSA
jgi:hypothetical protein